MAYNVRETPEGQQAIQTHEDFSAHLKAIRDNNQLTPEGKREQITEAYNAAKTKLDDLRARADDNRNKKIGTLRRDLFGVTGTADPQRAISYRDAQDRVSKLELGDQDKALKLLDQAEMSGDEVMTKALVQRALELKWDKVANTYIEKHPYYGTKLEELWSTQDSPLSEALLTNTATFYITAPPEVSGSFAWR